MQEPIYITPQNHEFGMRLDRLIAFHRKNISRRKIRELIDSGCVFVNDRRTTRNSYSIREGDLIKLFPPRKPSDHQIQIPIVFEDGDIIVINKPSGVASDSTIQGREGCVPYMLKTQLQLRSEPAAIHRLDLDASGLMILSKKPFATKILMAQFRDRTVQKIYHAIVQGRMTPASGILDTLIAFDPADPRKMQSLNPDFENEGKRSQSAYKVLKYDERLDASLVEIELLTGRRHQIRVQFTAAGFPLAGDRLYGSKRPSKRLMLHARSIRFVHPRTSLELTLEADLDLLGELQDEKNDD